MTVILNINCVYFLEYFVTAGDRQSQTFTFKTFPDTSDFKPTFSIYGDLGVMNHVSVPKLIQDVEAGVYDMVGGLSRFSFSIFARFLVLRYY